MASQGRVAESDFNITGRHVQHSIRRTLVVSLAQLWLITRKYRAKCLWNMILGIRRLLENLAPCWEMICLSSTLKYQR